MWGGGTAGGCMSLGQDLESSLPRPTPAGFFCFIFAAEGVLSLFLFPAAMSALMCP